MQTSELDCPLCMEPLEIDDVNFYPCTCGYQVCRFCWHRIRTDENGLCPACRKAYSEDPAVYTPLSQDEIQGIIRERKHKDTQRKQKLTENRKHLANVRVVQKNLVFVVGLTQRLADPELLRRTEYFGKFGKIHKIVINNSTNYAGPQGPSASAYITFNKEEDAHKAILAVSNAYLDGRTLKASLGTTKYCSYFLRNIPCPKPDCMYLHDLGDEAASFTKEEMQDAKHQEYEQQLLSNYARKMGVNTDKDSKDLWCGASGSSLPSGSGWGVKEEDPETTYSHSPHRERESSPSFELYNPKDDDNFWEDKDWDVNDESSVPGQQEQTENIKQTPQTCTISTIPPSIGQTIKATRPPSIGQTINSTIPPSIEQTIAATIAPSIGQTRPPSIGQTRPPSIGQAIPPSIGQTIPPNIGQTRPPSIGQTIPPSIGQTRPPSIGQTIPPSIGQTRPPSIGQTRPPSIGQTRPPSIGQTIATSIGQTRPPSIGQTIATSIGQTIATSIGQTRPPSIGQTRPPSIGQARPPSIGQTIAPSIGQTRPPSIGQTISPSIGQTRPPSIGQTRPPSIGQTIPPSIGQTRPPSIGQTRPPSIGKTIAPSIGQTIPAAIPPSIEQTEECRNKNTQGWPSDAEPQTAPTNPLLQYQSAPGFFDSGAGDGFCSLGLTNLHLKVSADDELGFDPWNESSKGLADLLKEEVKTPSYSTQPSLYAALPSRTPFGPHQHIPSNPRDEFKSWQEGFRALLPNININFSGWSAATEGHQHPSEWSPATQTTSHVPSTAQNQVVRPPPGFEAKKPEPQLPIVEDPSIVWSKVIGSKADPIPIVPGIITNGYSGQSSGNGPTDLPGAVLASTLHRLPINEGTTKPTRIDWAGKSQGMLSLFQDSINTSGNRGQSSSQSMDVMTTRYTSDNQVTADVINPLTMQSLHSLDNDPHIGMTSNGRNPLQNCNFTSAIEEQRSNGKQSSNGPLKSTHLNSAQAAHCDPQAKPTARMFVKDNDNYTLKGSRENLEQPESTKRKVIERLA